jgi:hypothetical protein
MNNHAKGSRAWARYLFGLPLAVCLAGGAALVPFSVAGAKSTVNTFKFTGDYPGTLKLNKNNCVILSDDGFQVSLNKLKGKLAGVNASLFYLSIQEPKQGTYTASGVKASDGYTNGVTSDNGQLARFAETSGTIKLKGSKGSVDLTMAHEVGDTTITYTGTETVTGSWSCAPGAFDMP